jgi:glycosyltransferase involved in cell wall biosynthesis
MNKQLPNTERVLGLFFSFGMSVSGWYDSGLLSREKLIYEKLVSQDIFKKIYWFTYGSKDLAYQAQLAPGIEIVPMPKIFNNIFGKYLYSFFLPFIKKSNLKKCDFYKTNQMFGSWSAVLAKLLYKKKLFVRTGYTLSMFVKRDPWRKWLVPWYFIVERIAFNRADVISVTSPKDKDYVLQQYHLPSNKIQVLPNYIDTKLFKPLRQKRPVSSPPEILFVGRLCPQKNLENLFEAVVTTKCRLDIYGQGKLSASCKKIMAAHPQAIRLMGTVANARLPEIYNSYRYYVLPSLYEGLPKTLLEAMACGRVCIATEIDGVTQIVEPGRNGWLCATTATGLAAGIEQALAASKRNILIQRNARQTILQRFSLEKIWQQEASIYK